MPSQAEIDAAYKSVRALVNARAGWYANLISDQMVHEVVLDALVAAQKVRNAAPRSAATAKS